MDIPSTADNRTLAIVEKLVAQGYLETDFYDFKRVEKSDRKYEGNVYALFGRVTSTFSVILANFDPSAVTRDLLDFLKARLTKVSDEAFNVLGNSSSIEGEG